jgi:hypothetical protein
MRLPHPSLSAPLLALKKLALIRTLFFTLTLAGQLAFSAEVQQVKGTKVLITVGDIQAEVGTQFFLISSEGKKIAIIELKQIKNGKAIAEIVKGRAEVGATVQAKGGTSTSAAGAAAKPTKSASTKKKMSLGVLAGLASSTFSMDIGPIVATTPCPTGTCRPSGAS